MPSMDTISIRAVMGSCAIIFPSASRTTAWYRIPMDNCCALRNNDINAKVKESKRVFMVCFLKFFQSISLVGRLLLDHSVGFLFQPIRTRDPDHILADGIVCQIQFQFMTCILVLMQYLAQHIYNLYLNFSQPRR